VPEKIISLSWRRYILEKIIPLSRRKEIHQVTEYIYGNQKNGTAPKYSGLAKIIIDSWRMNT
jgi:hypothetical protein